MSFRPELLAYYERLGFTRNGTTPYPHPERLRAPAELILMTRAIGMLALLVLTACGGAREPADADLAGYRQELESRGREDQRVRDGFGAGGHVDSAQIALMMHTDSSNTTWLKQRIERWGWPTVAQVGKEAVNYAFLIVQHAVHDTAFMRAMLPAIQESYKRGDLDGGAVAMLTDRIEVKAGRPQIYGTQLSLKDGRLVLDPIADSAGVDARRRQMGLGPLAEYLRKADSAFRAP
jgi:hypothetical protein